MEDSAQHLGPCSTQSKPIPAQATLIHFQPFRPSYPLAGLLSPGPRPLGLPWWGPVCPRVLSSKHPLSLIPRAAED